MSASPSSWDRLKQLFGEAIELEPARRDAFVAAACEDDPDLGAELRVLLAAHDTGGPFLNGSPMAGAAHAVAAGLDAADRAPALAAGSHLGQYEILDRLGVGGMGAVYRAHDTTLDRVVALKMLHEAPASESSDDRVLREARAASGLNHPNICTVHEVGRFAGQLYLVMEYVAGQPLSALIPSAGLAPDAVVKYGSQIADALAHAHEHRVIHRDLTSANVVVSPAGRATVLDFGIARRLPAVEASPVAETAAELALVTGTPAYIAPELLRGRRADARTDVWALGVLLYEMAAGHRPFGGETPFEIASVILDGRQPELPPGLPPGLRDTIARCLERDPATRFQQAGDVRDALDGIAAATASSTTPQGSRLSRRVWLGLGVAGIVAGAGYFAAPVRDEIAMAVLPLQILSGGEDAAYLAIGLPDTFISRLAQVPGVHVRPTGAVLAYDQQAPDLKKVAATLGVEYVLTGTLSKDDDRIRVVPQLVRVGDGEPVTVWTRPYAVPATDLLTLQDDVTAGALAALGVRLTSAEGARVYRRYTRSPEAFAHYMQGRRQLAFTPSAKRLEAAVASFDAALRLDGEYVLAEAGLAVACARMRLMFAEEERVEAWALRANQAAQRARALDPNLAETHEAMAAVYRSTEFDWNQAIEESDRALALNPNLHEAHMYRASGFFHLGLLDRVPPEARTAMSIDPQNVVEPLRVQGFSAMTEGRYEDAVRLLEQANAGRATFTDWNLAVAYYYAGRQPEAEAMLDRLARGGGAARTVRRAQATLASVLAHRHETAAAARLIAEVTNASYRDHHVYYALGAAHAQLGDVPSAISSLDLAWSTGFPCYPWFARDPLLDPLRDASEFRQLLDRLRQSWELARAQHDGPR